MNPVIIGAVITGSMALIGTVVAAVITTRGPSHTRMGHRPSEAVALATATSPTCLVAAAMKHLNGPWAVQRLPTPLRGLMPTTVSSPSSPAAELRPS